MKREKMNIEQRIEIIIKAAKEKKAINIKYYDVKESSFFTDFFMIITATSTTHLDAIVTEISKEIKKAGDQVNICGKSDSGWMVADNWDVIVHVMLEEQREYYHLEDIWIKSNAVVYHE